MEAIQTFYKGYHFRSRLEARWAKFFDILGIKWVYEPEGFKHRDTWYLPDFWVKYPDEDQYPYPIGKPPERGVYVEIKGQQPTKAELDKCFLLAKYSHHWVIMIAGSCGVGEFEGYSWRFETSRGFKISIRDPQPLDIGSSFYHNFFRSTPDVVPNWRIESAFDAARRWRPEVC